MEQSRSPCPGGDPGGRIKASRGQQPDALAPLSKKRRHPWWRKPLLRLATALAPGLLSAALCLLQWTTHITIVNGDELFSRWARGERVIVAFWHNRILMMPLVARGHAICIMNSQHRDGEIATRAAARWGIRCVRGSTTRGGAGGFLQLVRAYRSGFSLAFVPDGPRGPRYRAKPGVIHLARTTGAPIIPVSYAASRATELRSWDRLIVPLPFARVVFVIGGPLDVPRHADDAGVEESRGALESSLNEVTLRAERAVAS